MTFAEIETFLTIANTKSITKTAETLFLSQPTVSHRLASLENELNFPLVVRKKGRKQVELTPMGLDFISVAERWVSLWKETQAINRTQGRSQVIVGCTDSVNNALFYPFYRSILGGDELDLKIRTHQSWELYEILNSHDIDIGFVYHELHYKNIISDMLLSEKLYLVQSSSPVIPKPLLHTDELDPSMELFLSWDRNYNIWHDRWFADSERPHFMTDAITLLDRIWTDPRQWLIAPESVIIEFARFRPLYVSELLNRPPDRICYRITHRYPKLGNIEAVNTFNSLLNAYIAGLHRHIPIGSVWGGPAPISAAEPIS